MIVRPLSLDGAYLLTPEPRADERGSFMRTFCQHELADAGVAFEVRQCNISHNEKRNTLRGLHFQAEPYAEDKIVSCIHGAIYDVMADLRPDSPTYLQWLGFELSRANRLALMIPKGFAHGFLTLTDDADVFYQMSEFYHAESARCVRFDHPAIGVEWPASGEIIACERDRVGNCEPGGRA